jgi:Fic family protein
MLDDAGYTVSRYVSLEQAIAESADAYYETLLASTHDWHDSQPDPWPWLTYFVDIIATAYSTFADRTAAARSGGSKQDRVRSHVLAHAADSFRMADIRSALPGVSDPTIRLVLDRLRAEGAIDVEGMGRNATWHRKPGATG